MSGAGPPAGLARRLVRNTLHAATGRMAAVLQWLLLTPWMLRALGTEDFAILALFFAFTGYVAALDLGIVPGTLRHVAAAHSRGDHAEAGAFTTLGLMGFALLGLLWFVLVVLLRSLLLGWLHIPQARMGGAEFAMTAGSVVFVLAGCANVIMAALQGCDRFDLANRVSLAVTAAQTVGAIVALRAGWGLRALVLNVGVGWAIGAVLGVWAFRRGVPGFRWSGFAGARAHAREALAFGGPMQVTSVLLVLHTHLDKFLLPGMVALSAVTPYELGSRVLGSVQTFPQMLLVAMLPAASGLHASGETARMRELYQRGERYLLSATVVMVACLVGSSGRLFDTWLGPGHADAAMVLRGLTLASGFMFVTGMASVTVRAAGRPAIESWACALLLSLHLGLSLWLLPRYGLRGAVVATLVPSVVYAVYLVTRVGGTMGWRVRDVLSVPQFVPVLACLAGWGASAMLDHVLPIAHGRSAWPLLGCVAAAGALASGGVLIASGYLRWREALDLLSRRRAPELASGA